MAVHRRQFERHPFRLPVTVAWGDTRFSTTTQTLALGGLFAACPHPPPTGTEITLMLTLTLGQGQEEVPLKGEVVYTTPDGIGVRFVNISPPARGKLRAFFLFRDLHCYNTENLGS